MLGYHAHSNAMDSMLIVYFAKPSFCCSLRQGPFNWALFVPDPANLELWDAGSLSVRTYPTYMFIEPEDLDGGPQP